MDLFDFSYRREAVRPEEIFPQFVRQDFLKTFGVRGEGGAHEVLLQTALDLWDGGYGDIVERYGFHEEGFGCFTGHCHQITPALGLVLLARGFDHVEYLEAYRVDRETNERMDPHKEQNPATRDEFVKLGRIPYCCLEIKIDGKLFYVSGKHVKRIDGEPRALLRPSCYRESIGGFSHQDDVSKSGIYLAPHAAEPFEWVKQTYQDSEPELFRTFAHMTLTL